MLRPHIYGQGYFKISEDELSGPADKPENLYEDENGNRYWESELRAMNVELSGIGSFFKKIGKGLKKVGKVALPFAATAVGFIPGIGTAASAAINIGLQAGQTALDKSGSGGGGGVAKGLQGITAFGNQIMQQLDALAAAVSTADPAQLSAEADKLVAALSDPGQVLQAKKGKDAAALTNFKSRASAKASEIKTAAAQRQIQLQQQQQQSQPARQPAYTTNAAGQTVPQQQADDDGGISTQTIVIALAALAGLFVVTRK